MLVKLWHQSHSIFPDDPGRFVTVLVILKSVIDRNSGHPDIHARLQWIAFRVEPQNRGMLCYSIVQQNHINIMMKRLSLLKRWFLPFQFAGQQKDLETFEESVNLRKNGPFATNT